MGSKAVAFHVSGSIYEKLEIGFVSTDPRENFFCQMHTTSGIIGDIIYVPPSVERLNPFTLRA